MPADHLDNIIINITLDPAPFVGANFQSVLNLADEATGTTLDGDRFRIYTTLAGVQTDNTAGFVSSTALAAATAAFSQTVTPSEYRIGRKGAAEAYDVALGFVEAADPGFYGLSIESRSDSDQLLVAAAVEASAIRHLFFMQSGDAGFLTTGFPAALTALASNERTVIAFHDITTEHFDTAYPANRLAFDPDLRSVGWSLFDLKGVAAYASAPSDSEKFFLDQNRANNGLPFGGIQFAPDPGVNANNRPIYEIYTADWFEDRLKTRIAAVVGAAGNAGNKIPVTVEGQAIILNEVLAQFQEGVTAGHFVAGQTEATGVPITNADIAAQRVRITGRAQLVTGARIFQFDFNFTRNPIFVEAA